MKKLKLVFPYPPSELLPNKHTHWSVKAKAAREAREQGYYAILEQRGTTDKPQLKSVALDITWYPPKGKVSDHDGLLSASKSYLDSLVDSGIIIDDSPKVIKLVSLHVGDKGDRPRTEIIIREV